MAVDSYGTHQEPIFSDSGAPDLAVDSTALGAYAARFGNHMVGTTTDRDNFAGLAWEGLQFEDTTLDATYVYYGGWRLRDWNVAPEFNQYGTGAQNVGATAKVTAWATPTVTEKFTYTAPGRATAQYAACIR